MYRYEAAKMRPPLSSRELYGILGAREQDGAWVTTAVIAPFSDNREAAARLAQQGTALQLCPGQLMGMVSDFLSQSAADAPR